MPIDSSIYFNRGPGFLGGLQSGMQLRRSMDERDLRQAELQKRKDIQNAYAQSMTTDEAGNVSFDPSKSINVLAGKGYGQEAYQLKTAADAAQRQNQNQKLESYQKQLGVVANVLGNTDNDQSWEAGKAQLKSMGIPLGRWENVPYDPTYKNALLNSTLTAQERIQNQMKQQELGLKQQEMQNKYSLENQKLLESQAKRKSEASIKREDLAFKQKQLEKKNEPLSIDQKIAKMGGEQRKRFDNIRMGKMALDDMSKALSRGISTFSLIGDNDYTVAASQWEEAIGRMQSGGAINKEEAARFRKMVPTAVDGRQVQVKKLNKMKQEMERRLSSFGFKPEDIEGFVDKTADRALQRYKRGKIGGMNEAVASEPQVFRTDQIEWAD